MPEMGLIYLDDKPYPVELKTYRRQDITDFSPRASLPGGQVMYSELGLYQGLTQDNWQHGLGYEWHIQNNAYLTTVGQLDTRHSGFVQRMTQPTAHADASSYAIDGYMLWDSDVWGWGSDGLVQLVSDGDTVNMVFDQWSVNFAFHTGENLIALPDGQQPYRSTSGSCDEAGKAFGYTQAGVDNGDLFVQADAAGTDGNNVRLAYESGGTAGSEGVVVSDTDLITVTIESGVSTATQIRDAINNDGSAGVLVTVSYRTNHDGTGTPATDPISSDAGDNLTLAGGSTSGTQAELLVESTAADAAILFKSVPWGDTGNQRTIQLEDTGVAAASEFVEVTADAIRISFDALTTSKQVQEAVRKDVKSAATMTTAIDGDENDLLYTAVVTGPEGNRIAIEYRHQADLSPGSESVECDTAPPDSDIQPLIIVNMSPNAIASQVMDAVNDDATANAYVSVTIKSDENGTGKISEEMAATRLTGGTSGEVADMVTVAKGQGDTNTGVVEAFTAGALQGGDGVRSWLVTGRDSDAIDYSWGIVYDGYVYCGVQGTNRVHYASHPDLRHIEATTDDPGAIYVGLSKPGTATLEVLGAHVFAGQMLFMRQDGLWRMDKDRTKARKVLNYADVQSSDNFRSWTEYQGQFVFPIRNELYMWNGVATNRITPGWTGLHGPTIWSGHTNVDWPYVKYGRFDNLTQVGRFLFCTARTNQPVLVFSEDLLCYDGVGWHKIATLIDGTGAGTISAMIFNPADQRLYYHFDNGTTAQTTSYIQLQDVADLPYDNYATDTDHYLLSSRYDGGFREVTKSTPSVLIEGTNLSTDHWIELFYSLDGADSWYPWGGKAGVSNIVISDGITELFNPLGLDETTLEYNDIQYRIFLLTLQSTGSPVFQRLTTRLLMRPKTLWGWSFQIPVVGSIQLGTRIIDDRTPAEMMADIEALRKKASPVKYKDIWGNLFRVHVTAMDEQAISFVSDEKGDSPEFEMRVNMSLAELG